MGRRIGLASVATSAHGGSPRLLPEWHTGLPNKVCPRLRDSACWSSGEITQPRTSLIREPCNHAALSMIRAGSDPSPISLANFDSKVPKIPDLLAKNQKRSVS